jgi:hypothetical protein
LVVQRDDDVFLVPFVEDEQTVFLKTIIPSRKRRSEERRWDFSGFSRVSQ